GGGGRGGPGLRAGRRWGRRRRGARRGGLGLGADRGWGRLRQGARRGGLGLRADRGWGRLRRGARRGGRRPEEGPRRSTRRGATDAARGRAQEALGPSRQP